MKFWFFSLALSVHVLGFGQHPCSESKKQHAAALGGAYFSVPGTELYDVHYVHLDVALETSSNFIQGSAETHAQVTGFALPSYKAELIPALTIDSVLLNGQPAAFSRNGNVFEVSFPQPLVQGFNFKVQVFYHGSPPNSGFFNGLSNDQSPSWGADVTWSLSQPFGARDWWPVKQSLQDKIDSCRVWITTSTDNMAGSNGLLQQVTPLPGAKHRFEWLHKHPIDYYLISVAVADYQEYNLTANPSNSGPVFIQNYVYDNPQLIPYFQADIDETVDMLEFFSEIFGPYPFADEKYGHCMAPFSGGMEHQTMTSQGFFTRDLTAHELGHQWFGDHVTCAYWKDIWINEGFASYSEYLFREHLGSSASPRDWMDNAHDNIMSSPGGSVYVDDTSSESRIFSGRLSYDKGAAILHSLRFVVNNDSLFFLSLRNHLQAYGQSTATGDDFKQVVEQTTGLNLQTFFQQWYYGEGFPTFSGKYQVDQGQLFLEISQQTSAPQSIAWFETPLELEVERPQGDTLIRVLLDQPVKSLSVPFSGTVDAIRFDPNQWLINQSGSMVEDQSLSQDVLASEVSLGIHPNPCRSGCRFFASDKTGHGYQLMDIRGKLLRKGYLNPGDLFPVEQLSYGTYLVLWENGQRQLLLCQPE